MTNAPPCTNRKLVELTPTFVQEWSPIIQGIYWNDGKYSFFPQNTKIHMQMTVDDIASNFQSLGATLNN